MKDLNKMFKPDSVAVIGASNTPGKVGYIIIDNIISGGYKGKVYPINPKSGEIQGLKAYENIKDVPEKVDLVIMSIPAAFVNALTTLLSNLDPARLSISATASSCVFDLS